MKRKKKKKKKNNSFINNKEIIDDLKKSITESENEKENSNQYSNVINQERKEENVTKHFPNTKTEKIDFEKLVSKNPDKKFLMDKKNSNKENNNSLQEIFDNFSNADSIINKYISEFKSNEEKKIFFKKQGFILTEKSMERMALLIHYILNGIPVLFEGNTGTSKTRTTLTACNYIKKFIKKKEKIN